MHKYFKFALAALGLLALARLASAAPEEANDTRSIDARVVRVKLDGMVDLRIRQGSPALLILRGDPRFLEKLSTVQSGDTLHIGTEMRGVRLQRARGLAGESYNDLSDAAALEGGCGNAALNGIAIRVERL